MHSGEVLGVFPSMAEASRRLDIRRGAISSVFTGRTKTGGGYYWRRPGDTTPPPKRYADIGMEVEQVDMKTGQVVAVFPSYAAAARALEIHKNGIRQVAAECKSRSSYKGYFWRKAGDSTMPKVLSKKAKVSHLRQQVEQVCPETGAVIATFNSSQEAARKLKIPQHHVSKVLRGVQKTTRGYHFRKAGKPEKFKRSTRARPVQQLCLESGEVLATFPSQKTAGTAVGVTGASIRNAAMGNTNTSAGYRWRYVQGESDVQSASDAVGINSD